jgi:hypothetical protein
MPLSKITFIIFPAGLLRSDQEKLRQGLRMRLSRSLVKAGIGLSQALLPGHKALN